MFAKMYGPQFLARMNAGNIFRRTTDFYGGFLAESLFSSRKGILGFSAPRACARRAAISGASDSPSNVCLEILDTIFNPKRTVGRILRLVRNRRVEAKG